MRVRAVKLAPLVIYQASTVRGAAAYELPGYGFSNLGANPNQFASWNPDTPGGAVTTLTYRFDSSFTNDNRIRNQVRLAFDQWDFAWFTPNGATYSYLRNNGVQPFGDIRSIMVHEVGHALVYHHPDVGADSNRNYGLNTSPPPALITQADQNNEVMRSWIPPGAYNQVLSHDELDGYEHFYGSRNLNFTEITSGTANILISAGPESSSNTWAAARPAGVQRNASDVTQGWRLTSAPINFNSTSSTPMGFRTLGINWDYENPSTDKETRAFEIRTRGTTNTNPVFHYDGSAARHFNSYSATITGGADQKNDLLHRWSNPDPGDFDPSDIIHVGVEQDVWDWTVVSAQVVHPDGTRSNAPLLGFHDWNQTITGVGSSSSGGIASEVGGINGGPPFEIVAWGIRLVNSETIPVELTRMGLAVVDDMELGLADLNRETLNRLVASQSFSFFDIPQLMLDNGEELLLVFDGKPDGVTDPYFLNRPDLIGRELFVFAETMDPVRGAMVGNYALLGTPPVRPAWPLSAPRASRWASRPTPAGARPSRCCARWPRPTRSGS